MGEAAALQAFGSIAGGLLGRSSAKSQMSAINEMNRLNREGFELAKPYIKRMYEGGASGLDNILDKGYYTGATYAGLNPIQEQAARGLTAFGQANAGEGQRLMDQSRGFGQNYADIFNRASTGGMSAAQDYALNNSDPLVQAAMRDSTRQLQEQTLPGINRQASMSGNVNSSRAGVADALAQRAYDDRLADVRANVQDQLMARSLSQFNSDLRNQQAANDALKTTYGVGFNMTPAALGMIGRGEGILQSDQQMELDAARQAFEGQRDFDMNAYQNFGAGILGRAPMSPGMSAAANMYNPAMSGLMGAMQGFGAGGKLADSGFSFGNLFSSPTVAPVSNAGFSGYGSFGMPGGYGYDAGRI